MKTKLLAMMLLAGGSMFAQTQFSVGVGFGGRGAGFNQPPLAYASNIPPCPGPDYTWIDGYWSQDYGRQTWVAGYWSRQPFVSGYRVAPRFDNRFRDDDRRGLGRYDQNRNFSGQDRRNQRQNRDDRNRSSGPDNRGDGFRSH